MGVRDQKTVPPIFPMALPLSCPLPPKSLITAPITLSCCNRGMFPPLRTETSYVSSLPYRDNPSASLFLLFASPILDPELIQVPEIQAPRGSQGSGHRSQIP